MRPKGLGTAGHSAPSCLKQSVTLAQDPSSLSKASPYLPPTATLPAAKAQLGLGLFCLSQGDCRAPPSCEEHEERKPEVARQGPQLKL